MRPVLLIAVTTAVGCAAEPPDTLWYQSTLDVATRGVVLHEGGESGHAGMMGTNCPFETTNGTVTGDYDLPGEGESVQDNGPSAIGPDTVAVVLAPGVWLMDKSTGDYTLSEIPVPGAREVRLVDAGVVVQRASAEGCSLAWMSADAALGAVLPVPACVPGVAFAADFATDATALAEGDAVRIASPEGAVVLDVAADRLSWDPSNGALYLGSLGSPLVEAVDPDGTPRWTADLGAPVTALRAAGRTGNAVAVVAYEDGTGALAWLDGETGEILARVATPEPADDAKVSADGATIALVTPRGAHFFRASPRLR